MNWAWANSLDQIWRSPSFPMWLTLAAAGFFAIIMLITISRPVPEMITGLVGVVFIALALFSSVRLNRKRRQIQ